MLLYPPYFPDISMISLLRHHYAVLKRMKGKVTCKNSPSSRSAFDFELEPYQGPHKDN
jgi:hypothetical protein